MASQPSPTLDRGEPPFAPLSPEFAKDPYSAYAALRRTEGLSYFADFDVWMASRFADVSAIVMDPRMVRSLDGIASAEELARGKRAGNWHDMPHHARFVQFSLLDSDGEVHDRLRRQVFKAFTPVRVARLRDEVQGTVDRLVAGLPRCGEFDFIEDFAAHVPGQVIGRVLGVPDEDCAQLRVWSENIVQFFDIDRSDERKRIAEANTTAFYEYLTALKRDRQRSPRTI
jgi:cytochrome P450